MLPLRQALIVRGMKLKLVHSTATMPSAIGHHVSMGQLSCTLSVMNRRPGEGARNPSGYANTRQNTHEGDRDPLCLVPCSDRTQRAAIILLARSWTGIAKVAIWTHCDRTAISPVLGWVANIPEIEHGSEGPTPSCQTELTTIRITIST